jgi:hypothetical protein
VDAVDRLDLVLDPSLDADPSSLNRCRHSEPETKRMSS